MIRGDNGLLFINNGLIDIMEVDNMVIGTRFH